MAHKLRSSKRDTAADTGAAHSPQLEFSKLKTRPDAWRGAQSVRISYARPQTRADEEHNARRMRQQVCELIRTSVQRPRSSRC